MRRLFIAAIFASAGVLAPLVSAQAQVPSAERAAAIHECSTLADRYAETTYGSTEFYLYRSCMARHGQVE